MFSFNSQATPVVVNNHISVKGAAEYRGYSLPYLRRLLRANRLAGIKIGQVWLIDKDDFWHIWKRLSTQQIGDLALNNFFLSLLT